jgi:LysM repeat protein
MAAVLGVVFFLNLRDGARATQLATVELQRRLEPGERIIGTVSVLQRRWSDVYRATYGVLAATDRRVLVVGVVPELYAAPEGPRIFDVQSFAYDTTFVIAPAIVPLSVRGALVASGDRTQRFGVSSDGPALAALITAASGRAFALAETRRRERAFRDSIAALPPLREYHRVERGEALETIARRYETTADLIRTLNQLLSDRILVGQTLIVRESPRPIPPCPSSVCGGDPVRDSGEHSAGS